MPRLAIPPRRVWLQRGRVGPDRSHDARKQARVHPVRILDGHVRLRRHVAVDDCGRILNPMLVDGQVHGAWRKGWLRRCSKRSFSTTRGTR